MAASRAKYQKIHNSEGAKLNPEAIKQELYNARKQKLEHKLVRILLFFTRSLIFSYTLLASSS